MSEDFRCAVGRLKNVSIDARDRVFVGTPDLVITEIRVHVEAIAVRVSGIAERVPFLVQCLAELANVGGVHRRCRRHEYRMPPDMPFSGLGAVIGIQYARGSHRILFQMLAGDRVVILDLRIRHVLQRNADVGRNSTFERAADIKR